MLYVCMDSSSSHVQTDAGSRQQLQWLLRQCFRVCCLHGQGQQSRKEFLSHRDHIDLPSMPLSSFKMKVILLCPFLFRFLAFWAKGYFSLFMFTTLYNMYVDVTTSDLMWLLLCASEWSGTNSLKVFNNRYSRCAFQYWLCHNEANNLLN